MLDTRTLRITCIITYVFAFPLCVAHGAVGRTVLPAIGLLPLAFSSGFSFFLLSKAKASQRKQRQSDSALPSDQDLAGVEAGHGDLTVADEYDWLLKHRIMIFAIDSILGSSLLTVLIFTWIFTGGSAWFNPVSGEMLAAYATVPLMVNCFIHLALATQEFVVGSGLGYLMWLIFRNKAVPAHDCPRCGGLVNSSPGNDPHSARVAVPWYDAFAGGPRVAFRSKGGFEVPAAGARRGFVQVTGDAGRQEPATATAATVSNNTAPAWLKVSRAAGRQDDADLFVDEQNVRGPPQDRYRDLPDDASVSLILENEGESATSRKTNDQQ